MTMAGARPRLVVVTDLDGTLLDETTYGYEAAAEAIDALRSAAAVLVLATSKTRGEVAALVAGIGLPAAIVVENGGEVVIPAGFPASAPVDAGGGPRADVVVELGTPRATLVDHLAEITAETGSGLRGFSNLSVPEIAALTGLPAAAACLASERRFDEPFLAPDDRAMPAIAEAARRRGLVVTRGGRFHHLTGPTDKGRGLRVVMDALAGAGSFVTVGLGDSANDLSFLRLVDRPIVVPRPGHRLDPDLARALPRAERAPDPGPAGWNQAVLTLLAGGRLPPVEGPPR